MSARRRSAHSSRVSRQRSSSAASPRRVAQVVPLRVYPRASETRFDAWLSANASLDAWPAPKPSKARWRIAARASLPSPRPRLRGQPGERFHRADRGEVGADQVLMPTGSPSSQITKYSRQNAASTRDRPAADAAHPAPLPGRAVLVEGHRIVERRRLAVGDHAGPDHRYEACQQIIGGGGESQPGCANGQVQRRIRGRHCGNLPPTQAIPPPKYRRQTGRRGNAGCRGRARKSAGPAQLSDHKGDCPGGRKPSPSAASPQARANAMIHEAPERRADRRARALASHRYMSRVNGHAA